MTLIPIEDKEKRDVSRAYRASIRYLGPKPRSVMEIKQYLTKKKFQDPVIQTVVTRLLQEQFLDDTLFATLFVQERERNRPRSRFALKYELRQKGISDTLIDDVLMRVDEDVSARRALDLRSGRWRHLDLETRRKKMMNYLTARGFGYDVSRSACEMSLGNFPEFHED